jgi:hypothetical protein
MTMRIIELAVHDLTDFDSVHLAESMESDATLVVTRDTPAFEIAQHADEIGAAMVLVTEEADGPVIGVVFPELVIHQIKEVQGVHVTNLVEAVEHLTGRARRLNEDYGHEWLNQVQLKPVLCRKGGHYVYRLPCAFHG